MPVPAIFFCKNNFQFFPVEITKAIVMQLAYKKILPYIILNYQTIHGCKKCLLLYMFKATGVQFVPLLKSHTGRRRSNWKN